MSEQPRLSRRALLGLAGTAVASAGIGVGIDRAFLATGSIPGIPGITGGDLKYDFFGKHQQGIITPAQDRLHFAAFTLAEDMTRSDVIELLTDWSLAAENMVAGKQIGEHGAGVANYDAPPEDSGEAVGLATAGLTITFGFGPSFFTAANGNDRFGLAAKRPAEFEPLPHFSADQLDSLASDGDLCIQACSNDPMVAVHAIRNLTRIAFGRAVLKWSQLGYGRTSSTSTSQVTERNLFGYKDGTNNLKAENSSDIAEHVWVPENHAQDWLVNGTYLVTRRIRMNIESWDRTSLREQDTVFGRDKAEGAPLSGGTEFTAADFQKSDADGNPLIDPASHIAISRPGANDGTALLRRGYNFVDGNDDLGRLNAGLFFMSYQNTPDSFIKVQSALAKNDLLNEYILHTGSSLWVIPPGAETGSFVGAKLLLS